MLIKKLKKALKKAGLSEGLAELINITSADQIENIVNQLKEAQSSEDDETDFDEILSSEAFEEYVQEHGFDKILELSKTLQSEHDRKVTTGVKTGLENFLKKGGKKKPEGGKKPNSKDGDTSEEFKAIMDRLDKIENGNQKTEFSEKVTEALKTSKLSEKSKAKWANRIVEGDVSIKKQIEALETEQDELYKEYVGENASEGFPTGGDSETKVSEDVTEDLADNLGF